MVCLCCAQSDSFVTARTVACGVSSVHGDSPGENAGMDCHTPSRGFSQPTDGPQVSRIAGGDSEPAEKPKNTGVESLSLLQGNFPTQESNQGLLHCRWILYQLGHQGSPETDPKQMQIYKLPDKESKIIILKK